MKKLYLVSVVVGVAAVSLFAFGFGGDKGAAKLPSAKTILTKVKVELKKDFEKQNFFRLTYEAQDCIENLKLPKEFRALKAKMDSLHKQEEYLKCADVVAQMEKMLPSNIPTNYPFSEDYRSGWRSHIAELRVFGNDYQGAIRDYTAALEMKPDGKDQRGFKQLGGHQAAAYGRAEVYALLGQTEKALADLKVAPSYYWSGCGNCMEGSSHYLDRLEKVSRAAKLPIEKAEPALLQIAAGGYKPLKSKLNGDTKADEIRSAQSDATIILGEMYLRAGRLDLAKLAFEALATEGMTDHGRMARSRLKKLSGQS